MSAGSDVASTEGPSEPEAPAVRRTLIRLLKESVIPLALAALYAFVDTRATKGAGWPQFIKVFGSTFFFLMWLTGQYLRVGKQIHDRELLSGINADVQAIKNVLSQHATAAGAPTPASPESVPIVDPVARELMQQADASLASKLTLPALLLAASAFEYSVRKAANRFGVAEGARVPVRQTLSELKSFLPVGVSEELRALWDARNKIVHFRDAELPRSADASRLVSSYRWAITLLSETNLTAGTSPTFASTSTQGVVG
jgi:hypothetical protein